MYALAWYVYANLAYVYRLGMCALAWYVYTDLAYVYQPGMCTSAWHMCTCLVCVHWPGMCKTSIPSKGKEVRGRHRRECFNLQRDLED